MGEVAAFYTEQLRRNAGASDYLKNRCISAATAAKFGLGYSPDDRRYDAFRGRIMFPIRNAKGLVIGFGARTMNGDEQPKYLNSPETPISHKGSELYGYFEGREPIYGKGRAIVCEGYMDVIQLSQAGFEEAVAALGTSITPEHVRKLFKLTDSVYFSFDGDAAGRKAARRALEAALPVITDVQKAGFIILPPEHDPDSLIKAEGAEGFERQIEKAYGLTDFMKKLLLEGKEFMYAEERAKLVAEAKPWVLSMQHAPILRLAFIRELAGIARLQADDIERQYGLAGAAPSRPSFDGGRQQGRGGFARRRDDRFSRWPVKPAPEPRVRVKDVRERMLQCLLSYPHLVSEFSHSIEEEFLSSTHPAAERIIEVWRAAAAEDEEGGCVNPASLLMRLGESASLSYYEELLTEELSTGTPEEGARLEVRKAFIELERTKARIEMLAHDAARDMDAMRRLNDRRAELQRLADEARLAEREYRLRIENQARFESQRAAEKPWGGESAPLSSNPIVAQLQRFLRGDTGTSSVSGEQAAPQGASRVSTSAVREALAASAAGRTAGESAAFAESLPPELSDEKVDFVPDGMKEYDVSGMPPDVPFDDEAPCRYDDAGDPDADLNVGL
ncbi:MAG: DNA primase [Parasutterella sp.]|uniref:DNA primase n=1 Tax=Parasutterella sp. TaxID=2049037 RepID=UPI00399A33B6